jgi:hypothetical protein
MWHPASEPCQHPHLGPLQRDSEFVEEPGRHPPQRYYLSFAQNNGNMLRADEGLERTL